MSYSGDAAEQVVRMSLETGEVAIKLAGSGAKEIAVLLYSILKDQKRTRGKVRMESMIRSGKELKVFAVKDEDLERFKLSTVDMASIKEEIQQSREAKVDNASPERGAATPQEKDAFLDALFGPTDTPQEEPQKENPTEAGTGVPRQSEPTSESKAAAERGTSENESARSRPPVRKELREIREEQRRSAETAPAPGKAPLSHIEPRKKYKTSVKEI